MAKSGTTAHAIEGFAQDLGKMLGHARSRAEGWLGQRQVIVKNLIELRDTSTKLLSDLGHEAQRAVRRGRPAGSKNKRGPGRPIGSGGKKSGVKTRRKMSAKARAAISVAQKRRWAAQKALEKKKQ